MRLTERVLGLSVILVVLSHCAAPIPDTLETGFKMTPDAFSFANYAGEGAALKLDAALAVRMFGAENVCVPASNPCKLTDVAQGWVDTANLTLNDGRSEGMAVLAQLFFLKKLSPSDFGAPTAAELVFEGNTKLQSELAYWSATQRVAPALTADRKFQAKDVMPFLADVLKPGKDESWRLAVAIKTEKSYKGGHALTPIGFYRGEREGQYWLRVYDNNLPVREGRLEIDVKANTWTYDATVDPVDPRVYSGDGTNQNFLYFSPVTKRLGVLPCPFGADSDTVSMTTSGDLAAVLETDDRRAFGVQNGLIVETDGGRVIPSFSACDCAVPKTVMNVDVTGTKSSSISVGTLGDGTGDGGVLNVSGKGINVTVTNIHSSGSNSDTMTVSEEGKKVSYQSAGTAPVNMTATVNGATVSVKVQGDSSAVTIDATKPDSVKIGTAGAPAGTVVEVTVTVNGRTTTTTYTTEATDSAVKVNTNTGAATTDLNASLDKCVNGKQDFEYQGLENEADVDCGGPCVKKCAANSNCLGRDDNCQAGLICAMWSGSRYTTDKICRLPGCDDRIKNGNESYTDCGGDACKKCPGSWPTNQYEQMTCNTGADCESGMCMANGPARNGLAAGYKRCQALPEVQLVVKDLALGAPLKIRKTFDGVTSDQTIVGNGGSNGSVYQVVSLGRALNYSAAVVANDGGATCAIVSGASGGARPDGGIPLYYPEVSVECQKPEFGNIYVRTTAQCSGPIGYKLTAIDGVSQVTTNQTGVLYLGRIGKASPNWEVRIESQPYEFVSGGHTWFEDCGIDGLYVYKIGTYSGAADTYVNVSCTCEDRGPTDAGSMVVDAGVDAGRPDAGFDAGRPDAGFDAGFDAGVDAGPAMLCTTDSQCAVGQDCECGANSGQCAGNSGHCGAGKAVVNTPTTNGIANSGTFTVPTGCSNVSIAAWGAAGGPGSAGMFPMQMSSTGGAGGFISGVLPTAPGDVFTVWVGQGGGSTSAGGMGSYLGTPAKGGAGITLGSDNGGAGGGLTSVKQARDGGVVAAFSVPAGAGGNGFIPGEPGGSAAAGPTTTTYDGGTGSGSGLGGGGAGQPGGAAAPNSNSAAAGGKFGTGLPAGLTPLATSESATNTAVPPGTNQFQYGNLCGGTTAAGGNGTGGNGCVIVRCVAP